MTINDTSKEKPTGDGHPSAGSAINYSNSPSRERLGKAFETLRTSFTLHVHILLDVGLFLVKIGRQI